jgi:hypothetical protein
MLDINRLRLNRASRRLIKEKLNPFYKLYLNNYENATDTPMEFIFTVLLPSLGAAISLKRWIRWGSKTIYPNLWTMLVAESTNLRKSTALNIGLNFNEIMEQQESGRNYILPSGGSLAALLQVLEHEKNGVIKHSEVSSMLENMGKGFNNNMKSLFTDFYDVPNSYKVYLKNSDDLIVERPIFSMATATTVEWMKKNITKTDMDKKDKSLAIPCEPDEVNTAKLNEFFTKFFHLEDREIKVDDSFKEVYTEFYMDVEALMDDPFMYKGTKSMIGRIQTDIFLKLTILECVISGTDVADAEIALRVRYLVEFYLEQAFTIMDLILKTDNAKHEEKIINYLQTHKIISTTDLHRLFNNNMSSSALRAITNSMVDAGLIQKSNKGKLNYFQIVPVSEA